MGSSLRKCPKEWRRWKSCRGRSTLILRCREANRMFSCRWMFLDAGSSTRMRNEMWMSDMNKQLMHWFARGRPVGSRSGRWLLGALSAGLIGGLIWMNQAIAQEVTLNLKDADIRAPIETVSEITGTNFIVDPRVKGKITVISARPMDGSEIYEVFLSVLKVHGYAAVTSGT